MLSPSPGRPDLKSLEPRVFQCSATQMKCTRTNPFSTLFCAFPILSDAGSWETVHSTGDAAGLYKKDDQTENGVHEEK